MRIDIIAGARNTGKTLENKYFMLKHKNAPFIVIDPNDEYTELKQIHLKDVSEHLKKPKESQVRIIINPKKNKNLESVIIEILDNFSGTLLIEDSSTIMHLYPDFFHKLYKYYTVKGSMSSVNVGLVLQGGYQINKITMCSMPTIRLHFMMDSIDSCKGLDEPTKQIFSIAEKIIKNKHEKGDKYFFCYIDTFAKQIKGNFTEEEYKEACLQYLISKTGLPNYFN